MSELSGNELSAFTAVLLGLAAMFGATIFTFQTRHHVIDAHERNLQEECYRLHKMLTASRDNDDEARLRNVTRQLEVVRKRYDWALSAFILIMIQEFFVVAYAVVMLTRIASGSTVPVNISWLLACLLPGILALFCHIWGDLLLARKTQQISREWWDHRDDRNRVSNTGSLKS